MKLKLSLMSLLVVTMASAQDTTTLLHPDSVFTITDDEVQQVRTEANRLIAGEWKYDGACVEAKSSSLVAKVAKPIAKSKIKKKLEKAFKKIKLKKKETRLTLHEDGTFAMKIIGPEIKGKYEYVPEQEQLTLKWLGIKLNARLKHDGKKIHLLFDVDKFLTLMKFASGFSNSKTMQQVAFLSENFDDMQVGMTFK